MIEFFVGLYFFNIFFLYYGLNFYADAGVRKKRRQKLHFGEINEGPDITIMRPRYRYV